MQVDPSILANSYLLIHSQAVGELEMNKPRSRSVPSVSSSLVLLLSLIDVPFIRSMNNQELFSPCLYADDTIDKIEERDEFRAVRGIDLLTYGGGYAIEEVAASVIDSLDQCDQVIEPLAPYIYKKHFQDPCALILDVFDKYKTQLNYIASHNLFFRDRADRLRRYAAICSQLVDPVIRGRIMDKMCTHTQTLAATGHPGEAAPRASDDASPGPSSAPGQASSSTAKQP